ncbi:MAG: AMP-binding protein [bacterium]
MPGLRPSKPFIEINEEIERYNPYRFEQFGARYPDRIAVKSQHHELTYKELNHASNHVARTILTYRGAGEEPVALLFDEGAPLIAAIIGVIKAGKIYISLDLSLPLHKITYMLEDMQAALIVTNNLNLSLANELAQNTLRINVAVVCIGDVLA